MRPVLERGHDAEVPSTAAQGPEELRVLALAGPDALAVGRDDLGGQEVVDRHPVRPAVMGVAAREREAGDSGLGDDAARDGEAVRLRGPVDVGPRAARLGADGPRARIDLDPPHRREVDDDAAVAGPCARDVVSASAHRDEQPRLAGERHCGRHVGLVGAACDERRPAVDHAVPDAPGLVVARIARLDDLSAEPAPETAGRAAGLGPGRTGQGRLDAHSISSGRCLPSS